MSAASGPEASPTESPHSDVGILSDEMIAEAARRPQHPSRKARIGFIGAGWWATTNHMPLLAARNDVEMVAVCGLDTEVLSRVQQHFGFQYATPDANDLLSHNLDAVVVASPHRHHAAHAVAALEAGCHVLVEKPMCTRAGDARRLVALARDVERHLLVSYGWHHRPLTVRAKELMDSGAVGTVEHVACHMGSPSKEFFMGTAFRFGEPPLVAPEFDNYTDPELSQGGYGQAQLSHALGLLTWLTDLEPQAVYAAMGDGGARDRPAQRPHSALSRRRPCVGLGHGWRSGGCALPARPAHFRQRGRTCCTTSIGRGLPCSGMTATTKSWPSAWTTAPIAATGPRTNWSS